METESWDDKSDPSNDYPDPSDDYTADNPMSPDLASQLLSVAIYKREHLKLRLAELEKKIRSYREIVVPISQLPEDTLREIFVRCITDQDASFEPRLTRCLPKPVPICLAQVCSSWRSVAMSMPALWSTLYIRFHPDRTDHIRITCAQAYEWLARSGTLPLTILVDTSMNLGRLDDDEDIILFIKSLIRYSHRCRILRFTCPCTWLGSWISVSPADVPILRAFEYRHLFHWKISRSDVYTLWSSLKLLSAASLREVSLIIPHIPPEYDMPRLLPLDHVAFATLTQLHLRTGHASLVEMWHILNCCPQLEQCLLAPGRRNPTNNASIPEGSTLILPNLTTLRLHDTRGSLNEAPEFFSQLDLPSLDSFQLFTVYTNAPWENMECCLRVTDLCIESCKLVNRTLRDLLRGNHFIRRLRLATSQGSEEVLPYLFPDPDTPEQMLCPQLETLEIDKFSSWSTSDLITLLTTRLRLRQVFLDIEDVDMSLLQKLEDLESTLPVRVSITCKTLERHYSEYYGRHERLVQYPEWPLSEWELTGGTLLSE